VELEEMLWISDDNLDSVTELHDALTRLEAVSRGKASCSNNGISVA